MTKYKVYDERNQGVIEGWTYYFDNLDDANTYAQSLWNGLLPKEQKYRHVYVSLVKTGKEHLISDDVLCDENYNEDGTLNLDNPSTWDCFEEWRVDGAFNMRGDKA